MAPLVRGIVGVYHHVIDNSVESRVCSSRAGTAMNRVNWPNSVPTRAASGAGVR
jgi:hypothetical protein